jgi:hypothetical protein
MPVDTATFGSLYPDSSSDGKSRYDGFLADEMQAYKTTTTTAPLGTIPSKRNSFSAFSYSSDSQSSTSHPDSSSGTFENALPDVKSGALEISRRNSLSGRGNKNLSVFIPSQGGKSDSLNSAVGSETALDTLNSNAHAPPRLSPFRPNSVNNAKDAAAIAVTSSNEEGNPHNAAGSYPSQSNAETISGSMTREASFGGDINLGQEESNLTALLKAPFMLHKFEMCLISPQTQAQAQELLIPVNERFSYFFPFSHTLYA